MPLLAPPRADPRLPVALRRELDRLEHDTPPRSHIARLARAVTRAQLDYRGRTLDAWLADLHVEVREHMPELALHELVEVVWHEAGLTALPLVLLACEDPQPRRQLAALYVLAHLPARASLPCLLACARSPRLHVRLLALQAITELGEGGRDACAVLLRCLVGADERERALAARALRHLAPPRERVVEPLRRALADASSWVREEAALALADLAPLPDEIAVELREWVLLDDAAEPALARAAAQLDSDPLVHELVRAWQRASGREAKRRWLARLEWLGVRSSLLVERLPLALADHERLLVHARTGAAAAALVPALDTYLRGREEVDFHTLLVAACMAEIRNDLGRVAVEQQRAATRVAASDLHRDRVALARLCGLALDHADEHPAPARALEPWLAQLAALGPCVMGRVVLALARVVLAVWEFAYPLDHPPRRVVEAFELWLAHPSAVGRVLLERSSGFGFSMGTDAYARRAGSTLHMLAAFAAAPTHASLLRFAAAALAATRIEPVVRVQSHGRPLESLPGCAAAKRLRAAIEDELLGWALGVWDPLAVATGQPLGRRAWLAYVPDDASQPLPRRLDGDALGRAGWARLVELAERLEWTYVIVEPGRALRLELDAAEWRIELDLPRCQVILSGAAKTIRIDVGHTFDPKGLLDRLAPVRWS